jgi:RNA polymerase sigma factor, sigma-70 family
MRLGTIHETEAIPLTGYPEYTGVTTTLNLEELSDEDLVRAFVGDRDEEAFDEIVNRYRDKVYGIALKITRNTSEAEDVMQEVFITLVEKLDTFREESKFSTWLYRVTVNAGYIRMKSEQRKRENEVRIEDYTPYNESGVLEGIQTKDWSDRPDELLLKQEGVGIIEKSGK